MHKKKPFSGKKKKEQLQQKRLRKLQGGAGEPHPSPSKDQGQGQGQQKPSQRSQQNQRSEVKFERDMRPTLFESETRQEIEIRKIAATEPLDLSKREPVLKSGGSIVSPPLSDAFVAIPERPAWEPGMDPAVLEAREQASFREWMDGLIKRGQEEHIELNYFESNIETWRQLWRVCERSHVVLYVVDCRHPLFHFSKAILRYVRETLGKPFILVLSKADLSNEKTLSAWEKHFDEAYGIKDVIRFSSFRGYGEEALADGVDAALAARRRKAAKAKKGSGGRYANAIGRKEMLDMIRKVAIAHYGGKIAAIKAVDEDKIAQEEEKAKLAAEKKKGKKQKGKKKFDDDDDDEDDSSDEEEEEGVEKGEKEDDDDGKVIEGLSEKIVVGAVGDPNVGKSSLINGLARKKVVSVSRTPGHTKHFQTYHLAKDMILCDCPGMVFPAVDRPKYLQVLCGLYPLPNLREPFSALRYVAEHYPLEKMYGVEATHPPEEGPWSPMNLAEAVATKRGYLTGRAGRPDAHRAVREILRDCVDGSVPIMWSPPNEDSAKNFEIELTEDRERIARATEKYYTIHPEFRPKKEEKKEDEEEKEKEKDEE